MKNNYPTIFIPHTFKLVQYPVLKANLFLIQQFLNAKFDCTIYCGQTNSSGFGRWARINCSRVFFFSTLFIFFSECGLSLKERRSFAAFASTGNINTTILNVSITYFSMTTLLTHTVAHYTKPSFRPKTNNQLIKKFLSLSLS